MQWRAISCALIFAALSLGLSAFGASAKPVEYVKVCSLYGAGFYYVPGTDVCVKLGGFVRPDEPGGKICQRGGNYYYASPDASCGTPPTQYVRVCSLYSAGTYYVPGAGSPCAPPGGTSYNWSGFYIGVNGGGGWARSGFDEPRDSTGNFDMSGFMGGLTFGYNAQTGSWVYGFEGTIDFGNISGSTDVNCRAICSTSTTHLGTLEGRLGYAFGSGRTLAYLKGGAAWGNIKMDVGGFPGSETNNWGWAVGAGLEYKIAPNWSLKVEYNHIDLGRGSCDPFGCGGNATSPLAVDRVVGGFNYSWSTTGVNLSDIRVKRDIARLAHLDNGLGVYRFRYLDDDQTYVGVMAQEVQKIAPDAVEAGYDGTLYVNYARLGLRMLTWEQWTEAQSVIARQ